MQTDPFRTASSTGMRTAASFDQGLRDHFNRVYGTMSIGLVITGLMAWFTASTPAMIGALISLSSNPLTGMLIAFSPMLVIMFAFNGASVQRLSATALSLVFFGFSAYMGWLLSVLLLAYTGESIARVFFITAATFAAMSIWGYTTKKDLSAMGSFLMMGVIGMIIAMVVNIFMQSPALMFVISGAGVLIYTLLVAYDTQAIKETYSASYGQDTTAKLAVLGALSLYINFIMLFQFLLSLIGNRE